MERSSNAPCSHHTQHQGVSTTNCSSQLESGAAVQRESAPPAPRSPKSWDRSLLSHYASDWRSDQESPAPSPPGSRSSLCARPLRAGLPNPGSAASAPRRPRRQGWQAQASARLLWAAATRRRHGVLSAHRAARSQQSAKRKVRRTPESGGDCGGEKQTCALCLPPGAAGTRPARVPPPGLYLAAGAAQRVQEAQTGGARPDRASGFGRRCVICDSLSASLAAISHFPVSFPSVCLGPPGDVCRRRPGACKVSCKAGRTPCVFPVRPGPTGAPETLGCSVCCCVTLFAVWQSALFRPLD